MARILIGSMPFISHVNPVLPLARKLVERGHDVRWYAGRLFQSRVEATGARYLPRKHAPDYDERELETVYPQLKRLSPMSKFKRAIKDVFLAEGPAQADDLEEVLRDWQPDVILSEPTFAGASIISHRHGIPWAALGMLPLALDSRDTAPSGLGLPPANGPLGRLRNRVLYRLANKVVFRDLVEAANKLRAAAGMPLVESLMQGSLSPYLYLQGTTEAFEYPRTDLPGQVHFVGPLLPPQPEDFTPPAWWHELDSGRPVVLVTQGTVANDDFDNLVVPTIKALAKEDVLVVVTTGGKPASSLKMNKLPENVRVETFIPYERLLPYVSVMVTNGGYGGVQTALSHGVPLVVAGRTEEKPEIGARVAWAGVGIDLKKNRPSVKQVGFAVREVLEDSTFWLKAQAVAADFKKHDPQTEAAVLIEKLAETRQPVLRAARTAEALGKQRGLVEAPATLSNLAITVRERGE